MITSDGMGLTIEDYCLELANSKNAYVFLLKNTDEKSCIESNDIDWAEPFYENQLQKSHGLKRFFHFTMSE